VALCPSAANQPQGSSSGEPLAPFPKCDFNPNAPLIFFVKSSVEQAGGASSACDPREVLGEDSFISKSLRERSIAATHIVTESFSSFASIYFELGSP